MKLLATFLTVLFVGCVPKSLLQGESADFRKVRWGYTKEMVLATEIGKRLHVKKGNVIIYNHAFGHVQAKIIYCFQDNRLTAAGYITDKPVKDVKFMFNQSVNQHGNPNEKRPDGLIWNLERTIVYANAYPSKHFIVGMPEWKIGGGIINHLYQKQEEEAGILRYWDCVWAYIDRNLYNDLHDERYPLDRLSFYEKMLFGVVKRNSSGRLGSSSTMERYTGTRR